MSNCFSALRKIQKVLKRFKGVRPFVTSDDSLIFLEKWLGFSSHATSSVNRSCIIGQGIRLLLWVDFLNISSIFKNAFLQTRLNCRRKFQLKFQRWSGLNIRFKLKIITIFQRTRIFRKNEDSDANDFLLAI